MRELLPLSTYEDQPTSFWRPALVVGLIWGVPMTLFVLRWDRTTPREVVIGMGLAGAVVFGTLLTTLVRFNMRQLRRLVYVGVWPIVPAAPVGEYRARVMCRLARGPLAVGGHLYIGSHDWVFVPHTRNGPLHRAPVRWEDPTRFSLATRPSSSRLAWWLFGVAPVDRLVVTPRGGAPAVFVVPNAAQLLVELQADVKEASDAR